MAAIFSISRLLPQELPLQAGFLFHFHILHLADNPPKLQKFCSTVRYLTRQEVSFRYHIVKDIGVI